MKKTKQQLIVDIEKETKTTCKVIRNSDAIRYLFENKNDLGSIWRYQVYKHLTHSYNDADVGKWYFASYSGKAMSRKLLNLFCQLIKVLEDKSV